MKNYIDRKYTESIIEMLELFPAVTILGPRQSGKTTLAKQIGHLSEKEFIWI